MLNNTGSNKPIERVRKLVIDNNLSIRQFEQKIGVSNGSIQTALKRKSNLKDETLNSILQAFPEVSAEWLLTGRGEMYKLKEGESCEMNSYMWVPLVNQRAQAGFASGWGDHEYMESLEKIPFEVDREYKGRYVCFEVNGDSMDDGTSESILENDYLLCREVPKIYWKDKLHINQWDFVIVHRTDGILVKRIIAHDTLTGKLILHSLNDYYQDQAVFMDDLTAIFNVVDVKRNRRR